MTDNHTVQQRKHNMSQIKSKNTKPEVLVRKHLFKNGFRYRTYVKDLPGKPDIVMKKYKTVIFVNGCFWHKHDCKYFIWPKSNTDYWQKKITSNIKRDKKNQDILKTLGWNVITIWECEIKHDFDETMDRTIEQIMNKYNNCLVKDQNT